MAWPGWWGLRCSSAMCVVLDFLWAPAGSTGFHARSPRRHEREAFGWRSRRSTCRCRAPLPRPALGRFVPGARVVFWQGLSLAEAEVAATRSSSAIEPFEGLLMGLLFMSVGIVDRPAPRCCADPPAISVSSVLRLRCWSKARGHHRRPAGRGLPMGQIAQEGRRPAAGAQGRCVRVPSWVGAAAASGRAARRGGAVHAVGGQPELGRYPGFCRNWARTWASGWVIALTDAGRVRAFAGRCQTRHNWLVTSSSPVRAGWCLLMADLLHRRRVAYVAVEHDASVVASGCERGALSCLVIRGPAELLRTNCAPSSAIALVVPWTVPQQRCTP